MSSEKGGKKDKNQNIQVFLRLRPLNQRERDIKSLGVVEVVHNREVVVRQSQQTQHTKKFTFDHAFGPDAKQVEVYQHVVSPLIEEVLAGYNCTVFAYGQTGTGKTHTMVGENSGDEATWQTDPLAGIIPRALSQLFDELRLSNTEYTVRVSYLELYNEELFDLLSSSEDNSKLRIYEDMTRKGSNIVHGLEEVTVYNKNEVYKIMAQGQERKRVASTLMNAQSSRSHTVFTILVHMKENSPEGEELVKIGKLNLVDLAGSENISKAGSDNPAKRERARECVNINQSLLTLGRVITALVERHPHIPYRESKLTRILQESLGGRTKTSIIATISPGHKDLEETMSTLEYAHRAKNIQNKPEVNQKMTKKAILKEYSEEIDRLKKDLQAARDKNGVYLANETFAEMNFKQEEQRKEIQELLLKKRAMEEERDKMEYVFTDLNKALEMRDTELNVTKDILSSTKMELDKTHNVLVSTKQQLEEQSHLVSVHHTTESNLLQQAKQIIHAADTAADHAHKLHDTVDRFRGVENGNLQITRTYREQSRHSRDTMLQDVQQFAATLVDTLNSLHTNLENISTTNNLTLEESTINLNEIMQKLTTTMDEIKSLTQQTHSTVTTNIASYNNSIRCRVAAHRTALLQNMSSMLRDVSDAVGHATDCTLTHDLDAFVKQWYTEGSARISSLQKCQEALNARLAQLENKRTDKARKHRDCRRHAVAQRTDRIKDRTAKIEADVTQIQQNLKEHLTLLSTLHKEREVTEDRLNKWAQEERTAFDSKIQEERRLFELKIQEEKKMFEENLQTRLCDEKEAIKQQITAKITELESSYAQVSTFLQHSSSLQQDNELISSADLEQLQEEQADDDVARADLTKGLTEYGREFDDECHAIKAEMEALTTSVIQIVEPLYNAVVDVFVNTKDKVQKDSEALLEQDNTNNDQLLTECAAAFDSILNKYKDSTTTVINTIESTTTDSTSALSTISSTNATISSTSQAHCTTHRNTVQQVQTTVQRLHDNMRDNMGKLHDIETKYLSEEYRVYSPSGATPVRTRYVYPQKLAATSPHERILARFRASRANNVEDDECVIVDSDTESRTISDSECSLSESSVFVAPSPLPVVHNHGPPQPPRHGIVKCTSESDIYAIKRNEENPGKENTRSVSKRSKLPAPAHSSHKKPLVERNAD